MLIKLHILSEYQVSKLFTIPSKFHFWLKKSFKLDFLRMAKMQLTGFRVAPSIFVMMDRYARWPKIKVMTKTPNADMTIKAMEEIFQRNRVPIICQSDNGSPFQSADMTNYANQKGYEPVHVTPEWPRANGMVERFNRSMKWSSQPGR